MAWFLLVLLLVANPVLAQSSLNLEEIPHPGPQTGERFDNNFKAIKAWSDKVDANGDDIPDKAAELGSVPVPCSPGVYPTGVDEHGNSVECEPYSPNVPTDWPGVNPLPNILIDAVDTLAARKVDLLATGTITEEVAGTPDPSGVMDCVGPQCVHLGNTYPCLWYSTVEGSAGWVKVCAITIGAAPPATCTPGQIFIDTDQTVDTNCATTADNSLCLCVALNTWVALENN